MNLRPMPKRLRERLLKEHLAHRPIEMASRAQLELYLARLDRAHKIRSTLLILPFGRVRATITQSWWGRLFDRAGKARDAFLADTARHGLCVCEYTADVRTAGLIWPRAAKETS